MRYPTIDALRGFALISMVSSHVSLPDNPTEADIILHKAVWIDGAFYFVALSGLVAGLVHRRIVDRYGFNASATKLTKRAGFIYLVQLFLVALTITLASVRSSAQLFQHPDLERARRCAARHGRRRLATGGTELHGRAPDVRVLPAARRARRVGPAQEPVVGRGGRLAPPLRDREGPRRLPLRQLGRLVRPFGWQLLFIGGLLLGWTWEHERLEIPERLRRYSVIASIAATAVFLFLALKLEQQTEDVFGPLLGSSAGRRWPSCSPAAPSSPPTPSSTASAAGRWSTRSCGPSRSWGSRASRATWRWSSRSCSSPRSLPAAQRPDGDLRRPGRRVLGVRRAGSWPSGGRPARRSGRQQQTAAAVSAASA